MAGVEAGNFVNLYMHLINGGPAEFQPQRGTICHAGKACRRFAISLKQIRSEQKVARAVDAQDKVNGQWTYGYVRLQFP